MGRNKEQQANFENGIRKCGKCEKVLPLQSFNTSGRKSPSIYCKSCTSITVMARRETVRGRFQYMLTKARIRAHEHGVAFNLDRKFLEFLWESQKGLCMYTGVEMTLDSNYRNTVSLDRIVPSLGYVKDNVVLCCYIVNTMKHDMTHDELMIWCRRINDHDEAR